MASTLPPDTATGYTLVFIAVVCYTAGFGLVSIGERLLTSVLGAILISVAGSCVFTAFDSCFVSSPDRLGPVLLRRQSVLESQPRYSTKILDAKWSMDHVAYRIEVSHGRKKKWLVTRRYSEFARLVHDSFFAARLHDALPPKEWLLMESGEGQLVLYVM